MVLLARYNLVGGGLPWGTEAEAFRFFGGRFGSRAMKKRGPRVFLFFFWGGDEILITNYPVIWGIVINHYKDPYEPTLLGGPSQDM